MPFRRVVWLALALAACTGKDTDPYIVCFRVGDDKFATLQEAVDAATDGDTVHVCEDIAIDGARVVGKSIILRGGGRSDSFLSVPGEEAAIVAIDADVTVWDMALRSEGASAIRVERGKLTLDKVDLLGGGYVTLDSEEADIVATDVFVKNDVGNGCIQMVGGTLDLQNSEVANCNSFGLSASQRARAKLVANRIANVAYTNGAGYLFEADGTGIVATDLAIIETEGNTFENVSVAAVQVEASTLSMKGDTIDATFVGVLTLGSDVKLADLTLDGIAGYGGYLRTSVVDAQRLAFTGDAATGYGVYAPGSTMTLAGATVKGFDSGGVVGLSLSTTAVAELTLSDVAVSDVGELGVAVIDGNLDADGVTVTGVHDPTGTCVSESGDVCNFAVAEQNGSLTWTGGSVTDNEAFGFFARGGRLELSDVAVTGHPRAAIDAEEAAVVLQRVDIGGAGLYGLRAAGCETALADVTIHDGGAASTELVDLGGEQIYTLVTPDDGVDIFVSGGALDAAVLTVGPGDGGLVAEDAAVEIADGAFSGLHHGGVWATGGSLTLRRVTVSDTGAPAVQAVGALFTAEDLVVTDAQYWDLVTLGYIDGALLDEVHNPQRDPAVSVTGGAATIEGLAVDTCPGPAFVATDAATEIDDLEAVDVDSDPDPTDAAVDVGWTTVTPVGIVSGLSVDGAGADGVRIAAFADPSAVLDVSDLDVGDVAGAGITLVGIVGPVVGVDVDKPGGDGIVVRGGDATLVGDDGVRAGRVAGAKGAGLRTEDATLAVSDLTISGATASGLDVRGGAVTLTGVSVEAAAAWGLACDASAPTDLATCDATLDGRLGRVEADCGDVCAP